jgi:hypothetical protein
MRILYRYITCIYEKTYMTIQEILYMILFKKQIDILLFIGLSNFHINKMVCLIFCVKKNYVIIHIIEKHLQAHTKKS